MVHYMTKIGPVIRNFVIKRRISCSDRVPHNQHKMRITQATSNPLEYLLALCREKVNNPSQSMMEMSGRALTKLTRLLYQCKWSRE